MLDTFLEQHRDELVERCRVRVNTRRSPGPSADEARHGVPPFLQQLIETLRLLPSGTFDFVDPASNSPHSAATYYGAALFAQGLPVDEVVHGYGDLCQAITQLAFEKREAIGALEFRTLNNCLDNAIAAAVLQFARDRDHRSAERVVADGNLRVGELAHEMRNFLNTAQLARAASTHGAVGPVDALGRALDRSLTSLRDLIDRSLGEVRANAAASRAERIGVAGFVDDVKSSAALEANARGLTLHVDGIDAALAIHGDREALFAALGNVVHNAFKFTHVASRVDLSATAEGESVVIEVADRCGGLPPDFGDWLFQPFAQGSTNRSGVGLGLAISRRAIEENGGSISARNVPGVGCVFRISLPRVE